MTEPGVIPPLYTALVDDAAIFPPGNLPLDRAVTAHHAHRAAWYADLVGPFLVSSPKLAELAGLVDPTRPLRVAVVVVGGADAVGPAVAAVLGAPGLVLAGVETAGDVNAVLSAYHEHVPEGIAGAVEIPSGPGLDAALDAVATTRHRAKFRTGGTTAEAFPTAAQLHAFVAGCVRRGLPFKLTAGLHHAQPYVDPETGFAHHGFLDVLGMLPQAPVARELFTGFGSCSVADPLADLVALGLVAPPTDAHATADATADAPADHKEQHP